MINWKNFTATKAFIIQNNKVLILRESSRYKDGSNEGKYDLPGGRIEPGQNFLVSLKREILEETGLNQIEIVKPFHVGEWRPIVRGENWQIIGIFFECTTNQTNVNLSGDHDYYEWINPQDYNNFNLTENVREAFAKYLQQNPK